VVVGRPDLDLDTKASQGVPLVLVS
jgi:hypothetical protein